MLASTAARAAVLILIWTALTDGEAIWPWGIVLAFAAAAASLPDMPVRAGRFRAMLRFFPKAPFLAREAIMSGWDVATRALKPRMPLQPGFLDVPLRGDPPQLRMAVAYAITIMPGTMAVTLTPDCLHLHVVDERLPNRDSVRRMEHRLAPLFGNART